MKIDATSISSTGKSQVSGMKDDEELKSFSDALKEAKDSGEDEKLKKAAQNFEAFFINSIFKNMRNSQSWGEGLTEKSHARGIYEGMMDEKISDEISTGRGIGIGDMIYKQMSKSYGAEVVVSSDGNVKDEEADKTKNDVKDNDGKISLNIKG